MSPYVVKRRAKQWVIVNKLTGKTVGHSDTKTKAQASVRARMAAEHRKRH